MFEKMFDDEAMVIALELIAQLGESVAEELERRGHTMNRETPHIQWPRSIRST